MATNLLLTKNADVTKVIEMTKNSGTTQFYIDGSEIKIEGNPKAFKFWLSRMTAAVRVLNDNGVNGISVKSTPQISSKGVSYNEVTFPFTLKVAEAQNLVDNINKACRKAYEDSKKK